MEAGEGPPIYVAVDLSFCWGRGCANVVALIVHGVKPNAEKRFYRSSREDRAPLSELAGW